MSNTRIISALKDCYNDDTNPLNNHADTEQTVSPRHSKKNGELTRPVVLPETDGSAKFLSEFKIYEDYVPICVPGK